MRPLFIVSLICILFFIGFAVYIEIENKKFVENLPHPSQAAKHQPPVSPLVENNPSGGKQDVDKDTELQEQHVVDEYDWRTDTVPSHQHENTVKDPWESIFDAEKDEEEAHSEEVWFHITDPYERAEAYRAQLIKQYGDQAAIDVLAELKPKIWQNIPLTLDEMIRHAEAQMEIWPTEGTRNAIERFKEWKAEGREVNFQYGSVPRSTSEPAEFRELNIFVSEYGREEGVRRFRAAYPEKAAALKQYLLKEAPRHGVNPDEIERLFPNPVELKW